MASSSIMLRLFGALNVRKSFLHPNSMKKSEKDSVILQCINPLPVEPL
jgi:hypothetical protein